MLTVEMVLQPKKLSCIMRDFHELLAGIWVKSLATLYAKNRIKETTLRRGG